MFSGQYSLTPYLIKYWDSQVGDQTFYKIYFLFAITTHWLCVIVQIQVFNWLSNCYGQGGQIKYHFVTQIVHGHPTKGMGNIHHWPKEHHCRTTPQAHQTEALYTGPKYTQLIHKTYIALLWAVETFHCYLCTITLNIHLLNCAYINIEKTWVSRSLVSEYKRELECENSVVHAGYVAHLCHKPIIT